MITREELFAAVRTIRDYCANQICFTKDKGNCLLTDDRGCALRYVPETWHVPEEGGCGEADKKTNCSDCGNQHTPVCKYCEHDAEGGGE